MQEEQFEEMWMLQKCIKVYIYEKRKFMIEYLIIFWFLIS